MLTNEEVARPRIRQGVEKTGPCGWDAGDWERFRTV